MYQITRNRLERWTLTCIILSLILERKYGLMLNLKLCMWKSQMIWVAVSMRNPWFFCLSPKSFLEDVVQPKSVSSKRWSAISLDLPHLLLSCSKRTNTYILHLCILLYNFIWIKKYPRMEFLNHLNSDIPSVPHTAFIVYTSVLGHSFFVSPFAENFQCPNKMLVRISILSQTSDSNFFYAKYS